MEPGESPHDSEKIERLRRAMYSRDMSEKLGAKPRRPLDPTRPIVGEDWRRPETKLSGSMVAPRTIGLARAALWWTLVASVVFFVAALAFFGYYFVFGGGSLPASPGNIDIAISGPVQIASGETTQLQITVTNRNRVPLQLADLVITYPSGTRSPVDLSTDLASQRIPLDTIEPGGQRQGTVSAVFAGGTGAQALIKVDLEYRLEGSSAIFVANSDYTAVFSSTALSVSVEGNAETISGQPIEFIVTVASNAPTPVRDVLLAVDFPFGFKFTSATPQTVREGTWELGDIAPGSRRQIVIRGTLTGENGDERVFRFTAGTRKTSQEENISVPLSENSFTLRIADAFLGLAISVDGRSGNNVVAATGKLVNVSITWRNNLSAPITDAVVVAQLTGISIDGATTNVPRGFYRSSDRSVLWNKTSEPDLANLAPGATGKLAFSFQMPDSATIGSIRNPTITVTVNAAGKRVAETGVPQNLQSTAIQRIAIASDLTLDAQGLYYANPFGSVGPLPPKAEVETTYAIVFTLTNTTADITDARLSATLPPYVRWVGIYSPASEKLTFNQNDGTFVWDIGIIKSGTGVGSSIPRQAAIAIGLTPSTSQVGQTPVLLQNITMTGIDSSTGASISRTTEDVTTNIIGDTSFNSSQATVVK